MNVVFLCPNVPYPPLNGGHHRSLRLIRSIARFASVNVLAIGDPRDDRAQRTAEVLSAAGATLSVHRPTGPGRPEDDEESLERRPDAAAHFRSQALATALARRFAERPVDVAHVEEVVMAQYLDGLPCPRVIDRQKVDWAYHEAMAQVAPRDALHHLREAARFRWWERRLVGEFDRMFVPGQGDRQVLEPLHGPGLVEVVPIGIGDDLSPPSASVRRVQHVLLFGARDYGPNVEAEHWFFRDVWPELRATVPHLRAIVAGSGRPPLRAEPPPSDGWVQVLGFVPDIKSLLQGPGVLAVPVPVGGGARTKILEALACAMPVVSTAVGVENLDLVAGRDFLRAETAAEMVAAVSRLARDPDLVTALGRAGAARAEAFRWSRIETMLEPIYREAAADRSGAARARSADHARRVTWEIPLTIGHLHAELSERDRRGARATRFLRRTIRRLRRTRLAMRAEAMTLRLLDSLGAGAGLRPR